MARHIKKFYRRSIWISVSFVICLMALILPLSIKAAMASFYLSPSSGNYSVGSSFFVSVKLDSNGVAINAAEGNLIFNPAEIRVVSILKNNSIFNLWTTEPSFSNSLGNITFGGGTPKSFSGISGTIITIKFKAIANASGQINFSSGSALAADGKGTNVLKSMQGANYIFKSGITQNAPAERYTSQASLNAPSLPVVSSNTHPEENKWYSNNSPKFSWKLPNDITGVSFLLHKKLNANPGPISDGLINSKDYENIKDGIWYFHIKFKNKYGWGKILHRKVLIDTQPPKPFKIIVDKKGSLTNPSPILYFDTEDSLSGIKYYEITLGDHKQVRVNPVDLKQNPYQLPPQLPGKVLITVKAFDKAGNVALASTKIEIVPIATPTITKFPQNLNIDEKLSLEGKSLPGVKIKVFLQKEENKPVTTEIKADNQGKWSFLSSKSLEKGKYQAWVQAQDKNGALSLPSKKINFEVNLSPFIKFGKIAVSYLIIMIVLIVLIIGIVMIIFYAWYQISLWRKRLRKETNEISQSVNKAFRALREEVQEQIEHLNKKSGLSKNEKEIRDKLREALDISEEFIGKEIKDVEKELE